jgi:6,7-dimethyl-8-ribityllumazine synthase
MGTVNTNKGDLAARDLKFAIVAARFNEFIVEPLLNGALVAFKQQGVADHHVEVVRVPGAFELPLIARKLAMSKRYDAVVALGAVIRGDTPHFDYVCSEVASGLTRAALDSGVPVVFGVLTTDTVAQAQERAGPNEDNKGAEAALVAIEMANLVKRLDQPMNQ